jgi:carbonic anhydrase
MKESEKNKEINFESALVTLKKGNGNFVKNLSTNRNLKAEVEKTSHGQTPFAAVLSCIDSRVPVETIFDLGIGDVFSFRAAGNFVDQNIEENNNILGSLEFANASGVKIILVLGHAGCGAIKAAIGEPSPDWCKSMGTMVKRLRSNLTNGGNVTKNADKATEENVCKTIKYIRKHSTCLGNEAVRGKIIGGVYNIATGSISLFKYIDDKKIPL